MELAVKSEQCLQNFGVDCNSTIENLRLSIFIEQRHLQVDKVTCLDWFKNGNLRRTFIVIFAQILPQPFGLTLLGNASYFM